jgi:hypothetical protein
MRNVLKAIGGFAAAFLTGIAVSTLAFALVLPQQYAPRQFSSQQTHYLRINVTFNSVNGQPCVLVSNACSVKAGAVPYNALILRAYQEIVTSFNSGTTDTLAVGISKSGAELVAAQSVHGAAGGPSALTLASSGSGIQVTGAGATQTGANGGFDIWVTFAQTGAAPSAGQAILVVEYIAPNDSTCQTAALGATASAC